LPAAIEPWAGEDVDIDVLFAAAWSDMVARQAYWAKVWGLSGASFAVDQEAGLIEFERSDGAIVRAPVQCVGAWNPAAEIFSWAWGHPSVQPRMRRAAERARWFGERHGLTDFIRLQVPAQETDAWRYAAVTMRLNGASGVYRAPSEGPLGPGPMVFMIFQDPSLVAGTQWQEAAE
jgi:hypothetical protein